MTEQPDNEGLIVRYLLGELTEPEQKQIEENFLADDNYFEQILIVEDDLIDAYARGQLSPAEREQFEKSFLTNPQRRQRVAFARTLMQAVSQAPNAPLPAAAQETHTRWQAFLASLGLQNRSLQFALMAAALALLVVGVVWLSVRRSGSPAQKREDERIAQQSNEAPQASPVPANNREQTEKTQQTAQANEQTSGQSTPLNQAPTRASHPVEETVASRHAIAFLILKPTVRSTGETNTLKLKSGQEQVQIQIPLEDQNNYQSYALELRTAGGAQALSQSHIKARQGRSGRSIVWTINARNFINRDERDYTLKINGMTANGETETVGDYFFRIIKK
ncbi:MAG: hypothetical protein WBP93_01820 [Pyrinomonadaceae bacterium]